MDIVNPLINILQVYFKEKTIISRIVWSDRDVTC